MLHLPSREILRLKRKLIIDQPCLFIPGMTPIPKILGAQREVNPGSQSWTSPGTFSWTIPNFNTLNIVVAGAGGGGSGAGWAGDFSDPATYNYTFQYWPAQNAWTTGQPYTGGDGNPGGYAQFAVAGVLNMVAGGGAGGPGGSSYQTTSPLGSGANGTGSGGNLINYTGSGNSGGTYGYAYHSGNYIINFSAVPQNGYAYGGYGGVGGRCDSKFTQGQLNPGSTATIVVQAGGAPGYQVTTILGGAYPTAGTTAGVYVSWT
jgi:hypothetical protein